MYKSMEENENPPASTQGIMNIYNLSFICIYLRFVHFWYNEMLRHIIAEQLISFCM